MRHVVVIQHVLFEDLGTLEPALRAANFDIEILQAGVSELSRAVQPAPDLLVVLGGPIGVYEQTEYPFLKEEIRLIAQRIDAGQPILGICLGAQLMAAALGANVAPGSNGKELGWSPLTPGRDTESSNPLASILEDEVNVLHWHGDTFDLPEGARHLASTSQYINQAFSLERFGLALQFHPEVTATQLERWYIGHAVELAHARVSVPELRADSHRYASELEERAGQLWDEWLQTSALSKAREAKWIAIPCATGVLVLKFPEA
jgi:GMP synthase (glutamine-hydrolysing)